MPRYRFVEWTDETGAVVGTTPAITLLIDRDRTLTAHYEEVAVPTHTLTISATVGGTTSPAPGSYVHDEGTVVRVTAYPGSGYLFDHWVLDGVTRTENPTDVLMDRDHTLHAVFVAAPPPEYTLTISATAGGTTSPAPGTYTHPEGTVVRVTAVPSTGYRFSHWELDGAVRTENPIDVVMDRNHALHAVFEVMPPPEHILTITSTAGGTTDLPPGAHSYPEGTTVTVTAIPDAGYLFDHWELDGAVPTENPVNVFMDRDHALHAVFVAIPPPEHTLAISSTAGGTTDPAPGFYRHPEGTVVRVTAIPDAGYLFDHWELDGVVRTENPVNVFMDRDHTLHAVFAAPPPPEHTLTISATAGGTTSPALGSYRYLEGSVAMVIAYPEKGYLFDHWLIDGVTRETENPIRLLMDKDHTLHAVFVEAPPAPPPKINMLALGLGVAGMVGIAYYATKK